MEEIVEHLMAAITHRALSRPVTIGLSVKTPRGYGVVVTTTNVERISRYYEEPACVIVELDGDGARVAFSPRDIQVVEQAA